MNLSKLSVKQILDLDWDDIGRFDTKQSVTYEKRLRRIVSSRLKNIKSSGLYSKAVEDYVPQGLPKVSYSKSTQTITNKLDLKHIRNVSQHNIATLKSFLEQESSTVTGIKAARKRQAARIFGANKKGRPNYQFASIDEERRFWAAYEEFKHQNPEFSLFSNRIQQFLGEETFWQTRSFNAKDLDKIVQKFLNGGGKVDIRSDPDLLDELEELL